MINRFSRPFHFLLRHVLPPLSVFLFSLFIVDALVRYNVVKSYLLPMPGQVGISLLENAQEYLAAIFSTGLCALTGFAMSVVLGTFLAIIFQSSRFTYRAFQPYVVFFQTVPIIAIAPLLVIWFGFGNPTVIAAAFIVSLFPVVANTLTGLKSTDPLLLDLFTLYGANRIQTLFMLRFPWALPQFFAGLRIASGLAVIGAIVGEFIAGGGLGAVIDMARSQQRVDKVFAAVFCSSLLGVVFLWSINVMAWIFLRKWHISEKK